MTDIYSAQYFDGQKAVPVAVRVLLLDHNIQVYNMDEETFVFSAAIAECSAAVITGKLYVYLVNDKTIVLVLNTDHPQKDEIAEAIENKRLSWFEKLFKQRLGVLIGILLALFIAGYLLFTQLIPLIALQLISSRQEASLGENLLGTFTTTNTIDTAETRLAQLFADSLQLSDQYKIHVTVVKEKEVNAFALPGGFIVINSGILQQMNSYEELAALLGHEVSHVNARHSLRSILSQLSSSAFLSVITGNATGVSALVLGNAEKLRVLSYSRKLEAEADEKGMQLLVNNKINPAGMVELMKTLQSSGDKISVSFLSTHPLTADRIKHAEDFISHQKKVTFFSHPYLEELWRSLKKEE